MPSTRYTVRLPPALDAAVQERLRTTGTPFVVLMRDALSAYLADTPPTSGAPTGADRADTVQTLREELAALRARVEILELALTTVPTPRRQDADTALTEPDRSTDTPPTPADSRADSVPTPADTLGPRRTGRRPGPLRQRILDLLQAHPEGLRAEELRVYLRVQTTIGDLLQGMVRGGVVTPQGRGPTRRYVLAAGR
jgi:hypothetical protein